MVRIVVPELPYYVCFGWKADIDERRLGVPNVEAEDDLWLVHYSLRTSV